MKTYRRLLTIAGSDSGGGAGIQADLKTFSALGGYGMSVITALTAQNTCGVRAIHAVPPAFVREQMEAVLGDIGADAVKIGMLFSVELIGAVAEGLAAFGIETIVTDPVMVAQSGDRLLEDDAVEALKNEIFPLSTIVTPNLPEAEVLCGRPLETEADMEKAALTIAGTGCKSVLIKGGHSKGDFCTDLLYLSEKDRFIRYRQKKINTGNNHGTGCTLSSAITACLARDLSLEAAVEKANAYINSAIRAGAGYEIGSGHGPVHHFFGFWD